jgi:DNA-binding CsgD family transcriptional regulator/sugar-specific transcriptional regulator TrmB
MLRSAVRYPEVSVTVLEELGLDTHAEAVYRVMLERRELGVTGISQHLGLSESKVRDALDRLADLALLRNSLDVPGELRPVSPEVGLRLLLQRQELELLARQERFAKSQAAISELISGYTAAGTDGSRDGVERLEGLDAIQRRLEELAHRATAECLSFMPGGAQSSRSLEASKPLDESMMARGLSVLTVYLASVRNDFATLQYARWLTERGGEVRTAPTLPSRMVLFDRAVALLPLNPEDTSEGAIELTGAGVLAALASLFHQVWEGATPVGDESRHSGGEVTGEERELLRLLAQGLTDEVAARRLGVSLRTVRRMMSGIMERLGARSRFEAGLRAAERQWLSD